MRLLFTQLLLVLCIPVFAFQLSRVEPAFWWTDMKNPELQIMFYGKDIAKATLSFNYAGVQVRQKVNVENPNYVFLYLTFSPDTKPGKIPFIFTLGKKKIRHDYELKARTNNTGAAGFNTSDVLYLIMPDRFSNGNEANDALEGVVTDRTKSWSRHGGDIKGVSNHLNYLKDLGVTAIWLNPVLENKMPWGSYHGYAITDFYNVDPRLGTNDEYRAFIDQTHQQGMKVVMDMIFNHCGSKHWWMNDPPTKDWINNQQPDNNYVQTNHYKWTLLDVHAPQSERDTLVNGWFSRGMPDLNQRNPHMARYLIQNSIWWIEYARIDGIRHDTHPYADFDFMAQWCNEVKDEYPDFTIVGEAWYPRGTGSAWWQRNSKINAKNTNLKTVMDFELAFTMQKAFDDETVSRERREAGLFKIYEVLAQDFLYEDLSNILIFLDNHDVERFYREDEKDLLRYKQALTFLLTTRGIPQLYYGTEILMYGTFGPDGDGAIRKDFPGGWKGDEVNAFTATGRTELQNEAWNYLQRLLQWRRNNDVIANGKLIHYTPDKTGVYVYARVLDEKVVLVVLNGTSKEQTIPTNRFKEVIQTHTSGKDVTTGKTYSLTNNITLAPREALILELKR